MFIKFGQFRISYVERIGETGFKTSLYNGTKKVGNVFRDDGKFELNDIEVTFFNENSKKELNAKFRNKTKIKIDDVEMPWTDKLAAYCLMENKSIYDSIKKSQQHNKLVVRFKGDEFFSVIRDIKNTAQGLATLKKNSKVSIDMTGTEFIHLYDTLRTDL